MRSIALLVLLCALSGVAIAQTTECQSIPKASERMACFDKAAAPKGTASKTRPGASSVSKRETVIDMLAAENAKLNATTKTICRGC